MGPFADIFKGYFPKMVILNVVLTFCIKFLTAGTPIEGVGWFLLLIAFGIANFAVLIAEGSLQ